MKHLLPVFGMLACLASAAAQSSIVLQHGTTFKTFSGGNIQAAIDSAVNNDFIYLSGGQFSGFTLDKKLAIIGAGYNPDSTGATGITRIASNMTITAAANIGTYLMGIEFNSEVYLNPGVSNISFSRCRFNSYIYSYGNGPAGNPLSSSIFIGECIFMGSSGFGSQPMTNSLITNSIFKEYIGSAIYSDFKNCVFFSTFCFASSTPSFSTYQNCIGRPNTNLNNSSYNTFTQNINLGVNGTSGSNTGSGNYLTNETFTSLFVNETNGTFDYNDDLHLTSAAYNTGGTGGLPIGLFGGSSPWKVGGLPSNPHISVGVFGSQTNGTGNLPVNFIIRAQGN